MSSRALLGDIDPETAFHLEKGLSNLGHRKKQVAQAKSTLLFFVITSGLAGLQVAFSVQFAEGTNFLLSLGVNPRFINLVWLSPPLCGAILQPLFGAWSDTCTSRWGRRKAFIAIGGIGLIISLLGISWSPALSQILDSSCSASRPTCSTSQALGVLSIVSLNISAQAVQVGVRAMMVDQCHSQHQPMINAWATRLITIANTCSYLLSYVDLPKAFPILGGSQLNALILLDSFIVIVFLSITCFCTNDETPWTQEETKTWALMRITYKIRDLPLLVSPEMIKIQIVQFFTWLAWFPFMLYVSSFISTTYLYEFGQSDKDIYSRSRAMGPLGLLCQSIFSLITVCVFPHISEKLLSHADRSERFLSEEKNFGQRTKISWLSYRNIWLASLLLSTGAIFGILTTNSSKLMIFIMSLSGISWGMMMWIPPILVNREILRHQESTETDQDSRNSVATVIGINNVSICVPQILAMIGGTFIFSLLEETEDDVPMSGIRYMFGGSCIMMLMATVSVSLLKK